LSGCIQRIEKERAQQFDHEESNTNNNARPSQSLSDTEQIMFKQAIQNSLEASTVHHQDYSHTMPESADKSEPNTANDDGSTPQSDLDTEMSDFDLTENAPEHEDTTMAGSDDTNPEHVDDPEGNNDDDGSSNKGDWPEMVETRYQNIYDAEPDDKKRVSGPTVQLNEDISRSKIPS
jgi:hypothetical protein